MDLQLRGKRALVTGSTAGIGFAAAAGLFKEGVAVIVNGRTQGRVEQAVGQIRGLCGDGQVSGIATDLSTTEGVAQYSVADLARQRGVDRSVVEAEFFKTARPSSFLKRFATPEEVAAMVAYVCSPRALATKGRPFGSMAASFGPSCEAEPRSATAKTNAVRLLDRLGHPLRVRGPTMSIPKTWSLNTRRSQDRDDCLSRCLR